MNNFESVNDFREALKEIHILIENAISSIDDNLQYRTFNKSSIVLLCGKFESFLECFLDEFGYYILNNFSNKKLESYIKNHLIDVLIKELEIKKNNNEKREEVLMKFVKILGVEEVLCNEFNLDTKFSYGKHGQSEVTKLLKKFGFNEFADSEENKIFYEKFNSLNNIRNNILHQDSTPSLTHQDVISYQNIIINFVENLSNESIKIIQEMNNNGIESNEQLSTA
ncbi:HEPN domain-containing protein [Flavobacterium sp. KACC 22763]|uniref:HEPN domain-containing protein n=1 Tax=Flavobacterium sp. KACC 22763 TaxID=3025668 RepID=UPI002366559C|nr:HEPN domain-containing protein [Flavobacterium sp. KACC 22763]WDF65048.1 HEPN domain-containing protein [Flavobacterium sp. KACC 22763]